MKGILPKLFLIASLNLFLLSMTMDAFCTSGHCTDAVTAFFMGWMMTLVGGANNAWFANLCLIGGWVAINYRPKISLPVSIVGIYLGSLPWKSKKLAIDEAGTLRDVVSFENGYWLWLSSFAVLIAGSIVLIIKMQFERAGQ